MQIYFTWGIQIESKLWCHVHNQSWTLNLFFKNKVYTKLTDSEWFCWIVCCYVLKVQWRFEFEVTKLNVIGTFASDEKWTILVEIWRKALDHFVSVAKVVITPITQILYGLWTPNSKNILEKLYAPDFPIHYAIKV